jgi:hypothetical protein
MSQVKQLLEDNTPFAVTQIFGILKDSKKETYKHYELVCINKRKELVFEVLSGEEISFFEENLDKIKLIVDNKFGRVYEFNKFKEFCKTNGVRH